MTYSHVQIVLYRPFLHYLTQMDSEAQLDERKSRCALACATASQDTIAIAQEMDTRGFVCAASWPSVYTTFLATVSLIFFTVMSRNPSVLSANEDANKGIALLTKLKCHDLGPKRCLAVLDVCVIPLHKTTQLMFASDRSSVVPFPAGFRPAKILRSRPAGDGQALLGPCSRPRLFPAFSRPCLVQ